MYSFSLLLQLLTTRIATCTVSTAPFKETQVYKFHSCALTDTCSRHLSNVRDIYLCNTEIIQNEHLQVLYPLFLVGFLLWRHDRYSGTMKKNVDTHTLLSYGALTLSSSVTTM
jgi:hypothetical protein